MNVHSALEVALAPALIVAPFALGFSVAAGVISFTVGVLLVGLALSGAAESGRGYVPLNAHAGLDVTLATVTVVLGVVVGLATDSPIAAIFLAGFGSAHLALTASTRYSRPLGV